MALTEKRQEKQYQNSEQVDRLTLIASVKALMKIRIELAHNQKRL